MTWHKSSHFGESREPLSTLCLWQNSSVGYVFGLEACSHPIWTVVEPVPRIGGMLFVWNSWARSQAKRKSFERDREITTNFGGQPSPLYLFNCGILTVLWRRTCQAQTLYLQQPLPITLGQKKIKLLSQPSLLPSGCHGHVYTVNEGNTKFLQRHCSLEASEIMWRIRHYVMSLSSGPCKFSH